LVEFLFCFIGLVVSYIAWGFFQERILTKPYLSTSTGNEDKFTNGEFLVFCNRIGSVLAGNVGIYFTAPHESYAPPFLYSFCAMSNVLSSWFQYEALKFITFPMQVLAKSCKIVATMGMGYFMNAKTYSVGQILTALTITVGLIVFKVGQSTGKTDDHELSPFFWLGMVLISCYIIADAFTSNWQEKIYKEYKVHNFQMMTGQQTFASIVALAMCFTQLPEIFAFLADHPQCLIHTSLMAVCSAVGSTIIFITIKKFGAVMFVTAMTARMIMSVLLSIFIFNHKIAFYGGVGLTISFLGLTTKVYLKYLASEKKRKQKEASKGQTSI